MDLPVGRFGEFNQAQIPSNIFSDELKSAQVQVAAPNTLPPIGGGVGESVPVNTPQTDRLLAPAEPYFKLQQQFNTPFSDFRSLQPPSDTVASYDNNGGMNPRCDQQLVSFNGNSSFPTLDDNTLDIIQVAPCDPSTSSGQGGPCANQFTFVDPEMQPRNQQQNDDNQQSLPPQPTDSNEMHLSAMCKYLAAITSNRLERCVAFCQRMPGFQLLSLQDKVRAERSELGL